MLDKLKKMIISYVYIISQQPVKLQDLLMANQLFTEGIHLDGDKLGFRLKLGKAYLVFLILVHIILLPVALVAHMFFEQVDCHLSIFLTIFVTGIIFASFGIFKDWLGEYQDTNPLQGRLLEGFHSKNLFCVGDYDQSIYAFNGSDKETINKDFNFVDINLDSPDTVIYKKFKGTTADFADFFHIKFYPTILFMEHNVVVSNIKGYRNKEKFRTILKYVSSKSYESMDLETFINEQEMKD